jgi:hypothetical protein
MTECPVVGTVRTHQSIGDAASSLSVDFLLCSLQKGSTESEAIRLSSADGVPQLVVA